jgi:hypothetical protein
MTVSLTDRAPRRSVSWLVAPLVVLVCLGAAGVAVSGGLADLARGASGFAECAADGCLDSETAYVAHLEASEPALPWERVRTVGFEDGEVVFELADKPGLPLMAALVPTAD